MRSNFVLQAKNYLNTEKIDLRQRSHLILPETLNKVKYVVILIEDNLNDHKKKYFFL